jgi:hypothetical protein
VHPSYEHQEVHTIDPPAEPNHPCPESSGIKRMEPRSPRAVGALVLWSPRGFAACHAPTSHEPRTGKPEKASTSKNWDLSPKLSPSLLLGAWRVNNWRVISAASEFSESLTRERRTDSPVLATSSSQSA